MKSIIYRYRLIGNVVLILFFTISAAHHAIGSHLRAGNIVVERLGCSRNFKITIKAYTKSKGTVVRFGDGVSTLDFGDGTYFEVPTVPNNIRYELDPDGSIASVEFSQLHSYSSDGTYTISFKEAARNADVVNMDDPGETEFYIETTINIDPYFGCSSSPVLSVPPIDRGCVSVTWTHNPGAHDADGDLLTYELVVPNQERNVTVTNYRSPADKKFYPTNYITGNEEKNGPPSLKINPKDGTITWDAPGAVGEYNIAFIVSEWRFIDGLWFPLGSVRRDMQIIIDDCNNERPELEVPKDTCIAAGTILKAQVMATDPDMNDKLKIEAFSQIFNYAPTQSPATFLPVPDFRNQPYIADFEWKTTCFHIREQPYQVVFKATDNGAPRLATFKSWFIRVVAPAPIWQDAKLSLQKRSVDLQWEPYLCNTEAEKMQVWRRVDKSDYEPDQCETGMPDIGYTLIAEVPLKDANNAITKFTDTNNGKGLAPGAEYCYRLVAIFPLPNGGKSYVSKDTCIGPILADAPVITNVSVEKTHSTEGEILVKWSAPLDADPLQFPPPYHYNAYRGVGLNGSAAATPVFIGAANVTSFTDTGLDTEGDPYNYQIVCFDKNNTIVDTSAAASSVRLESLSSVKKIELSWTADVPWSNQTTKYPRHLIYRGSEDATEENGGLILIDSVDVTAAGFNYVDQGQFNNTPLVDGQTYCYKIETRGSYGGTPDRFGKLKNLSQIICTQPGDTIPPCTPAQPVAANPVDCEAYRQDPTTCGKNVFENTITWSRPEDADCRNDVRTYSIYVSTAYGAPFVLLKKNITDTFYLDDSLSSNARCYKITAVDRSGNESELSEPICFDNCPYYELPNVFTPNGDDCNKTFRAYGKNLRDTSEGENIEPCGGTDESKCARFVNAVSIRIYNRWGNEVYRYTGEKRDKNDDGKNTSIYIDWNGRDSNGTELAPAVYYYVAELTFDTYNPTIRNKTIKGWVQLVR